MMNFYRRFVVNCADKLQSLYDLLYSSDKSSTWNAAAVTAFEDVKLSLVHVTLLFHPKLNASLNLMVDASGIAVGSVLQQYVNNTWQPLANFSKKA